MPTIRKLRVQKNYAVWWLGMLRSRDYVVPVVATTKLQTTNYKKSWLAPTLKGVTGALL